MKLQAYVYIPLPATSLEVTVMTKDFIQNSGVKRFQFVDLLERCEKGGNVECELFRLMKEFGNVWFEVNDDE